MPLTGDFAKMGRLVNALRDLANVPSRASVPIAAGLNEFIQEQFRSGRDPYGRPLRALKPWTLRKHPPPPLTDTGASAEEMKAVPKQSKGIVIRFPRVLVHHLFGYRNHLTGKRVVARSMLPLHGMPRAWRSLIVSEVSAAFRESLVSR